MLRRVALVRTDVTKDLSASIIWVTRICELGTLGLMSETLISSETSVFTTSRRRNIPEDAILHSHRLEIVKSYIKKSIIFKKVSLYDLVEVWLFVGKFHLVDTQSHQM
jgi:hypothetical protein